MGILKLLLKIIVGGVLTFIILLWLGQVIFEKTFKPPTQINYGVTFSTKYAEYLDLPWQELYIKILDDLKVKELRIPTYWDEIEAKKGQLEFDAVDFMLSQAQKRGARVVLVVGIKQPRWPECHYPQWIKRMDFSKRQEYALSFVSEVLKRYKDQPSVWAIQVENEPMLPFFGYDCPSPDAKFLEKEVKLVKEATSKPIIISDSGEFGSFVTPMKLSNIMGTTLYRKTYDPIFKYKTYPLLPYFYTVKSAVVRKIFAPLNEKTILIELQAEPWLSEGTADAKAPMQAAFFPLQELKDIIIYAKKTGFDTQYLWGVEWWYWMQKQGHPEYLEYGKTLFQTGE